MALLLDEDSGRRFGPRTQSSSSVVAGSGRTSSKAPPVYSCNGVRYSIRPADDDSLVLVKCVSRRRAALFGAAKFGRYSVALWQNLQASKLEAHSPRAWPQNSLDTKTLRGTFSTTAIDHAYGGRQKSSIELMLLAVVVAAVAASMAKQKPHVGPHVAHTCATTMTDMM
jgi:hypothetical protein